MVFSWSDIRFRATTPFINLDKRARVLQTVRLISGLIGTIWVVILLTGAFTNTKFYVNRLDCAHVDVSDGLFTVLRDSVSSDSDSLADNYGPGLTASEIDILTDYTETKVEDCPQYIKSNVFNWCFGNYNLTEFTTRHGNTAYRKHYTYEYCTDHDTNYVYDYRGELETIGLNIILAYAYTDSAVTTSVSDDSYTPDAAYLAKLASRKRASKLASGMLIFAGFDDLLVIILGIIMYGSRGYKKNDKSIPIVLKQTLALLSLVGFLGKATGVAMTLVVSIKVRSEIQNELGSFGITSHLGKAWFTIAWFAVGVAFLNLCAWAGPVWCGPPNNSIRMDQIDSEDEDLEDDEDAYYRGTPMLKKKSGKFSGKTYHEEVDKDYDDDYEDDELDEGFEAKIKAKEETHDSVELEEFHINPFADSGPREKTFFSGSDETESDYDDEGQSSKTPNKRRKRNFRRLLPRRTRKNKSAGKARSDDTTGLGIKRSDTGLSRKAHADEKDYVSSDIFMTEDEKFIMQRENLLLADDLKKK